MSVVDLFAEAGRKRILAEGRWEAGQFEEAGREFTAAAALYMQIRKTLSASGVAAGSGAHGSARVSLSDVKRYLMQCIEKAEQCKQRAVATATPAAAVTSSVPPSRPRQASQTASVDVEFPLRRAHGAMQRAKGHDEFYRFQKAYDAYVEAAHVFMSILRGSVRPEREIREEVLRQQLQQCLKRAETLRSRFGRGSGRGGRGLLEDSGPSLDSSDFPDAPLPPQNPPLKDDPLALPDAPVQPVQDDLFDLPDVPTPSRSRRSHQVVQQ